MSEIKKVVLAYSGGLDTSVILKWLQEAYDCAVVTFTADLGQGEDLGPARAKAEMFGVVADLTVHGELLALARDDARLILGTDPDLERPRGAALRVLLYLFERDAAVK